MTLHVACAAVGRYVVHAGALLHALAPYDVEIHYLHGDGLSARSRRRLAATAPGKVAFHAARDEGLPVLGAFTQAMWFRLQLPELVDADRVLHLDADTLPLGDPAPLAALDLAGGWVGAVDNVLQPDHVGHVRSLGLDPAAYFNSGVLLLDLAALRGSGAMDDVRAVARSRAGARGWPDQDALNLVLGPHRTALHPRWNAMNALWAFPDLTVGADFDEARAAPAIRHFEGPGANKPWARGSRTPHAAAWRAHRRASAFPRFARS